MLLATPLGWVVLLTALMAVTGPYHVQSTRFIYSDQLWAAAGDAHHPHHQLQHPEVTILAAHHNFNISWLEKQNKYRYVLYSGNPQAVTFNPAIRLLESGVTKMLREVEAYLTYIIEEYNHLPETVVFIHSHETAWHHQRHQAKEVTVMELLEPFGNLSQISYVNINLLLMNTFEFTNGSVPDHLLSFDTPGPDLMVPNNLHKFSDGHLVREFEAFLNVPKDKLPPYYSSACCAQFVISRKVLQSRPRKFWRNLLNKVYIWINYQAGDSRGIAFIMEWMWFYIFTGLTDEYEYMRTKAYIIKEDSEGEAAPS